jgi:chromatin remodeling complex protein RSC6
MTLTMRLNFKLKIFFTLLFLFFSSTLFAQSDKQSGGSKKIRKAEKVKEEQAKKQEKAIVEGKKKHRKLQSKEVRKRMKRNDRRYHHSDANDSRPNWLKRLFPKKRPSAN